MKKKKLGKKTLGIQTTKLKKIWRKRSQCLLVRPKFDLKLWAASGLQAKTKESTKTVINLLILVIVSIFSSENQD